MARKKARRSWLKRILFSLIIVIAVGVFSVFLLFRGSLAKLEGSVNLEGLSQNVQVSRDAMGIPSMTGSNIKDLAQATGFVHAQERFFQMDLLRKNAAGRLAELFGVQAADYDLSMRSHQLERVAQAAYLAESKENQEIVQAYCRGVNQGLNALSSKPFEYYLLQTAPQPWMPHDSYLVIMSMFLDLHDETAKQDYHIGKTLEVLGEEWTQFLAPRGTAWDAPIQGEAFVSPVIPGFPEETPIEIPAEEGEENDVPGSNNWAVTGDLTPTGAALLANDMHLGISNPNIWFRLDWIIPNTLRVTGVSLPGVPGIVSGSNGKVAWGFTNSYGDYYDLVPIELSEDQSQYRSEGEWQTLEVEEEKVKVKGQSDQKASIRKTVWGPVIEHGNKPFALMWTAHNPEAINFNLLKMMAVKDVNEALELAPKCGMPAQNLMVVDHKGQAAWTIIGRIPFREDYDGRIPQKLTPEQGWKGWLEPHPFVLNPESGRLWTANARVVSDIAYNQIGDGGYDFGARAQQIRDRLFEKDQFSERDFLDIQLDFEARYIRYWHDFIVQKLKNNEHSSPEHEQALAVLETWNGFAATDSSAYLLLKNIRGSIKIALLNHLLAPVKAEDPNFSIFWMPQTDGPVWEILNQQPEHLLPEGHSSWDNWVLSVIAQEVQDMTKNGPLIEQTWGKRNTFQAKHPMGDAIPFIGEKLHSKAAPLPGDSFLPRVQGRGFGASERMIVSPGHENQGIFHMPGGQSGHPLSPFYLRGINAWQTGEPTPFLPGPAKYHLVLESK